MIIVQKPQFNICKGFFIYNAFFVLFYVHLRSESGTPTKTQTDSLRIPIVTFAGRVSVFVWEKFVIF